MACVTSDRKHLAEALTTETEESCTTYNMLKVGVGIPVHIHQPCTGLLHGKRQVIICTSKLAGFTQSDLFRTSDRRMRYVFIQIFGTWMLKEIFVQILNDAWSSQTTCAKDKASLLTCCARIEGRGGVGADSPCAKTNYLIWRGQLLPHLRSNQLLGFLDGTISAPTKQIVSSSADGAQLVPNPDLGQAATYVRLHELVSFRSVLIWPRPRREIYLPEIISAASRAWCLNLLLPIHLFLMM
ncbi:hypothetical protein ACJX0J_042511, partial [Zea mays]